MTIDPLLIGKCGDKETVLLPGLANRHGLITGATGTGKTVTLQVLAERFSSIGVPVFMADVKGDLAGMSQAGDASEKFKRRLQDLKLPEPECRAFPAIFWDVFGKQGHPLRATVSDMGPLLLSRVLMLNETQAGVLTMVFKIADDNGLLLLDIKDLRSMLQFVGENAKDFITKYGNVSAASIGAIQRGLLTLEQQGGDLFLGEPMLNIDDLLQTEQGQGIIHILASDKLLNSPMLYSTMLLWLLSELFERLPEVGDGEKPKLVFFFDEAHLLFKDSSRALVDKIELIVRLIRSKGVGVYFVTQNPTDVPDNILGQLGNRVNHALRAFTPRDQKAVKVAAQTLRANPEINTETAITELGVGEALVSFLDEKGRPNIVERVYILPPASRIGPISDAERDKVKGASLLNGIYDQAIDRESAYEKLTAQAEQAAKASQTTQAMPKAASPDKSVPSAKTTTTKAAAKKPASKQTAKNTSSTLSEVLLGNKKRDGILTAAAKSVVRTSGNQIVRGILGSLTGGKK
jgi:DNA helicase HerA-like ATPase